MTEQLANAFMDELDRIKLSCAALENKINVFSGLKKQNSRNGVSGTIWITDGAQRKRVPADTPLPCGWRRGKK